ncbi:MAG TPA: MFS transporter [Chloroflexota bacterium]|nr:MFS transporter [Chloroflexota bacterium]
MPALPAASHAVLAAIPPAVLPLAAAFIAYLAAQGFGRFGFGLVLPAMRDGLGLSTGEMGLLAGIGLAAYLVSSVPAGALAARIGTRLVVVGGLLGTAVGLAATGFADGFLLAALAQILVGASAPAAIVPLLAFGGRWVSPSFRGRATGLVVAGGGTGLLLAGLLVPLLLAPGDSLAWRRAWWGLAGGVLVATVVAALFLRDPPGSRSQPEPAKTDRGASADTASADLAGAGRPIGQSIYRRASVWRLALIFGLYGVSYIVYGTFFAAHLERHGLDAATAGRLWSLAGLVAIGSGFFGGVLADRLGPSVALVILFTLQGAGMATLALGDGIGWFTVSVLVYGVSMWGFPAAITKACTELVGPTLAPAALGLMATIFAVGQAGGPIVAGLLADLTGSLAPGLLCGACTDAAGLAVAWWVRRDSRS